MRATPRVYPAAQAEFDSTVEYYASISIDLAVAFDRELNHHLNIVNENPKLYSLRKPGSYRRVNLGPRFQEYYVAYIIWREQVVVVAIAHAKRRPLYWRNRIAEAKRLF